MVMGVDLILVYVDTPAILACCAVIAMPWFIAYTQYSQPWSISQKLLLDNYVGWGKYGGIVQSLDGSNMWVLLWCEYRGVF